MKRLMQVFFIFLRLGLGGMMVWGGITKFAKPSPDVASMLTLSEEKREEMLKDPATLRIRNYVFGMKQTGFFWEFLGICEILGGLLLLSQVFSFLGAVMLLPISIHIFLFHFFLEREEVGELLLCALYLIANVLLIAQQYKRCKPLLVNPI